MRRRGRGRGVGKGRRVPSALRRTFGRPSRGLSGTLLVLSSTFLGPLISPFGDLSGTVLWQGGALHKRVVLTVIIVISGSSLRPLNQEDHIPEKNPKMYG